jgi:large subunit ribosomal protein L15
MKLNNIKDNTGANQERKRIGRGIGSGTGKTSGKGHKGQKARSGFDIKCFECGQMPIHRRLPKRGFNNINRVPNVELNIEKIEKLIDAKVIDPQKVINHKILMETGLVKSENSKIKLLGKGELKNKINIEVTSSSSAAKEIVEKMGGSVLIVNNKKSVDQKAE